MKTEQAFVQEMTLPYSAVAARNHIRLDRILTLFHETSGAKLATLTINWKKISHGPV
ncbi:MAG TPA: hypothetical protein VJ943_09075 [Desulfotignum sp.]|nr:hypothetical protein [Desulfotignum sp.]